MQYLIPQEWEKKLQSLARDRPRWEELLQAGELDISDRTFVPPSETQYIIPAALKDVERLILVLK